MKALIDTGVLTFAIILYLLGPLHAQNADRNLVINGLLQGGKIDTLLLRDSSFLRGKTGCELPGWEVNKCKGIYQPAFSYDSAAFMAVTLYQTIGPYNYEVSNVSGMLCRSLTAGRQYRVSFFVKPYAGNGTGAIAVAFTNQSYTNHFYFDDRDYSKNANRGTIGINPAYTSPPINPGGAFYKIDFVYTANGGEQFIYIGNFNNGRPAQWKETERYGLWGSPYKNAHAAIYALSHFIVEPLDTTESICPGAIKNIPANVARGGDTVLLQTIWYKTAEYVAKDEINHLQAMLSTFNVNDTVLVIGYTDSQGNEAHNQLLSRQRALFLAGQLQALIRQPILIEGRGSSNPVENKVTSPLNRRVEIYVIKY